MKIEQLNFVSYVKLLKMLILASEIIEVEQTEQDYNELLESISGLHSIIPEQFAKESDSIKLLMTKFLKDYKNSKIKNDLISQIDLISAKIA